MKSVYISILSLFAFYSLNAQGIADGLRYAKDENQGGARYTAMSGAMGALGGDLSAMEINPAGSAVFVDSYSNLSGAYKTKTNKSNYFNQEEKSSKNNFNLNQIGGVFVFHNDNEDSSFKKFTIGVNYGVKNNFSDEIYLAGRGNTSIAEFFLAQAQGIPLEDLQLHGNESISGVYRYMGETGGYAAQNAFLGYQAYLFDPLDHDNPLNSSYVSNVSGNDFSQKYLNLSSGYNARFTINFSAQVTDNLYFGLNINTSSFDFRQGDYFTESNNTSGSYINRIGFENNLTAYGSGISAQLGAIAKMGDNFRLGLSLDLPTWYQISEETSQYLESRRVEDGNQKTAIINPQVVNLYEDYTLKTPGKATLSAAYIFDQFGLISLDYSYSDFSNMKFTPSSDSYFKSLNHSINNTLKATSTLRAGGEYRYNQFSFRGGFHYEESPYKDDHIVGDLIGFSTGAGFNLGYFNIDFAYSRSEQKSNLQMYPVGFTSTSDIKTVYSNFILTLGYTL